MILLSASLVLFASAGNDEPRDMNPAGIEFLIQAYNNDDIKAFQCLAQAGVFLPESEDEYPEMAYSFAKAVIADGAIDYLAILLEQAFTDGQSAESLTVLLEPAVRNGNEDVVRLLISKGITPVLFDSVYMMPLIERIGVDDSEVLPLLVANGLDVTKKGTNEANFPYSQKHSGYYPIHLAARRFSAGSVELFMDHGAKFWSTDDQGRTPLHWAAEDTHLAVKLTCKELCGIEGSIGVEHSPDRLQ